MLDLWKIEPPYLQLSTQLATHVMFKDTTKFSMAKIKPMKEDPLVNMVISIATINNVSKNVAFKHKKNLSNPSQLSNGKKRTNCINLLK